MHILSLVVVGAWLSYSFVLLQVFHGSQIDEFLVSENVPWGQSSQIDKFSVSENVPWRHDPQALSVVSVCCTDTFSPATQIVKSVHSLLQ